MALPTRLGAVLAAVLLAVLAAVLPAAPVLAHESDPQLQTLLTSTVPPLPAGVVVQVAAGVAAQLVADNPTDTVLEVLGDGGRPFLRLSRAGVQGDLASPDFLASSNPVGSAGAGSATPRWVLLSRGSAWGWFDHRLHPSDLPAPQDRTREARLAGWQVPLRYGTQPVRLSGEVRFVPLRGTLQVTVEPAPAGVRAQVLQGRLPGLLVTAEPGTDLVVLGAEGEPFVELGRRNRVNVRSRTHVEDQQARGQAVEPATAAASYRALPGPSHSWLDPRLAYAPGTAPDDVVRAGRPAVLQRWEVPVLVGGVRQALRGEVRWVPSADLERDLRTADAPERGRGLPAGPVGAAVVVAVLGAVVVLLRRRRA